MNSKEAIDWLNEQGFNLTPSQVDYILSKPTPKLFIKTSCLGYQRLSYYKRVSKRRWKARCRLGKPIPRWVILDYSLTKWFDFHALEIGSELFTPLPKSTYIQIKPNRDFLYTWE